MILLSMARQIGWSTALILVSLLPFIYSLPAGIETRQDFTGIWAHDFSTFGCKPIIFIFAKETIAPGNVVCQSLLFFLVRGAPILGLRKR